MVFLFFVRFFSSGELLSKLMARLLVYCFASSIDFCCSHASSRTTITCTKPIALWVMWTSLEFIYFTLHKIFYIVHHTNTRHLWSGFCVWMHNFGNVLFGWIMSSVMYVEQWHGHVCLIGFDNISSGHCHQSCMLSNAMIMSVSLVLITFPRDTHEIWLKL